MGYVRIQFLCLYACVNACMYDFHVCSTHMIHQWHWIVGFLQDRHVLGSGFPFKKCVQTNEMERLAPETGYSKQGGVVFIMSGFKTWWICRTGCMVALFWACIRKTSKQWKWNPSLILWNPGWLRGIPPLDHYVSLRSSIYWVVPACTAQGGGGSFKDRKL